MGFDGDDLIGVFWRSTCLDVYSSTQQQQENVVKIEPPNSFSNRDE